MTETMQGDRAALERELGISKSKAAAAPAAGVGPKSGKASAGGSEYYRAKKVVEEWGKPLAYAAGKVFECTDVGWVDVTTSVLDRCNRVMGRNSENGAYRVLCNIVALPQDGAIYHRLVDRRWIPLRLGLNELLFSDYKLDLLTGETEKIVEPIFGPRIMAPYAIDGDEPPRCPEFEEMVATALPNPEVRRHFQEIMGLILQPHAHIRHQIVLWGAPGSRKSSIATAIACAMAGHDGSAWTWEADLARDKWSSIALYGKFCNVSDDSPPSKAWGSWLKRYSSGIYTVEAKYHRPEAVPVTAKLISTCNEMQQMADASGAAADRLLPFRFDAAPPRSNIVDRDKWLQKDYWSDPTNRAGVLTWLLEGLERLRGRGTYMEPEAWLISRRAAVAESDPTADTLTENLVAATKDDFVTASAVRALVPDLPSGRRGDMLLSRYIGRLFPGARKTRRKIGGVDVRGWEAMALANSDNPR